jgi:hypothetical protein
MEKMPPMAEARVPDTVMPIWTVERNFWGFSRMVRSTSALLPCFPFAISLILLLRDEMMANSPAEKTPFRTIRIRMMISASSGLSIK